MDEKDTTGKIKIIVLDGDECLQIVNVDKADIGKAIETGLPITIMTSGNGKPGIIRDTLSSVGEGIADTGKAAVVGVGRVKSGIGGFFRNIGEGIHDAAVEYDKRSAEKKVQQAKEHSSK